MITADQIRIGDNGELESVPVTWDGEPLYSPTTIQEGLFASEAFEQMPGQIAMVTTRCHCCREEFYTDPRDPRHLLPTLHAVRHGLR